MRTRTHVAVLSILFATACGVEETPALDDELADVAVDDAADDDGADADDDTVLPDDDAATDVATDASTDDDDADDTVTIASRTCRTYRTIHLQASMQHTDSL